MAIFRHSLDATVPEACQRGVLSLGNFDGVHRGHQALLTEAVRQAHGIDAPAIAVTFDPHPWQVLRPSSFQPLLTTSDDRAALLERYGADRVLILHTTPALLSLTAHEFFDEIVIARLRARGLVEGYNFAFGRERGGTIEVLRALCAQASLPLTLLPPQEVLGKAVSSSRVRGEILAGSVGHVQLLLARPYRLTGTVATGQRRGRTLGVPTANLEEIETLIPGDGVYAAFAEHKGERWPAAVNVGPNPTFGEGARKVEVHLIGFEGDLYGRRLGVAFLEKIRDTRPFAGVEDLVAQLRVDVGTAQAICTGAGSTNPEAG